MQLACHSVTIQEYSNSDNKYKHIVYGYHSTLFGKCLIAVYIEQYESLSHQAICHLAFIDQNLDDAITSLKNNWHASYISIDEAVTSKVIQLLFTMPNDNNKISILMKGSNFQLQVWHSLLSVNKGTTTSYEEIAISIGNIKATRAVARAIAQNRIAYLIPCHRILPKSRTIGNYRWGVKLKQMLIDHEAHYGTPGRI